MPERAPSDDGEEPAAPADEGPTPAELAQRIADALALLAHLATKPEAAGSLPAFSAQLAEMAVDQAALATELALREAIATVLQSEADAQTEQWAEEGKILEAELCPDAIASLTGPHGPALAGKAAADAEPLTWRAIPEAVARLAALAARPLRDDAGPAERAAAALDAAAARQVARLVPHLGTLVACLGRATGLHQHRDGEAPSLEATAAMVEGVVALVDGLRDLTEGGAGAPPAALREMLADVETNHRPTFSRSTPHDAARSFRYRPAKVMGLAACALDARMRGGDGEGVRMSRAAMAVAAAVHRATGQACSPEQVESWRERCMEGARGDRKGFGRGHPALSTWETYQREIVAKPERRGGDGADAWGGVAAEYEARMLGEAGGNPRRTDR